MGEEMENMPTSGMTAGQNKTEGNRCKSYSEVVTEGVTRKSSMFVGNSMIRKPDKALNIGDDVVVCFPGAKIENITERVEKVMGPGNGGSTLVHVGTNNAEEW